MKKSHNKLAFLLLSVSFSLRLFVFSYLFGNSCYQRWGKDW